MTPSVIAALAACLALAGCGGTVIDPSGRITSGPGGAYLLTKHVDGMQCPDLTLGGAVNISRMTLTCSAGSESATFENIDPTQAMARANEAMAQALQVLGGLAARGATGGVAGGLGDDPMLWPERPQIIDP